MTDDPFITAQERCDAVAQIHGGRAAQPLNGETLSGYRRRLVKPYQSQSAWRNVDLATLPADSFAIAEAAIYNDAAGGGDPATLPGQLRPRLKRDAAGRIITEFVGDPATWMSQFRGPKQRVVNFRTHQSGHAVRS